MKKMLLSIALAFGTLTPLAWAMNDEEYVFTTPYDILVGGRRYPQGVSIKKIVDETTKCQLNPGDKRFEMAIEAIKVFFVIPEFTYTFNRGTNEGPGIINEFYVSYNNLASAIRHGHKVGVSNYEILSETEWIAAGKVSEVVESVQTSTDKKSFWSTAKEKMGKLWQKQPQNSPADAKSKDESQQQPIATEQPATKKESSPEPLIKSEEVTQADKNVASPLTTPTTKSAPAGTPLSEKKEQNKGAKKMTQPKEAKKLAHDNKKVATPQAGTDQRTTAKKKESASFLMRNWKPIAGVSAVMLTIAGGLVLIPKVVKKYKEKKNRSDIEELA